MNGDGLMIRSARYTSNGSALLVHAQPLARHELEDVAGLDVLLALATTACLELLAGQVAVERRASSGPRGSISPSLLVGGCWRRVDDLVDPPARVAVGASSACPRRSSSPRRSALATTLIVLSTWSKMTSSPYRPKSRSGRRRSSFGGGGELLAFVVADRVVARVADQAAGERGEVLARW